jgi:hypothetical protein
LNSNSKSKRHLRWLVFLLLNVLPVRLRRLDPRRLDVIFDLKPEEERKRKGRDKIARPFLFPYMKPANLTLQIDHTTSQSNAEFVGFVVGSST